MAIPALIDDVRVAARPLARAVPAVAVRLAHRIDDVAAAWSALEAGAIQSPGQSLAFIRTWVSALGIAEGDQFYLVAERDGAPVALLPLRRRRTKGVTLLDFFPGAHVGCNAPLVDASTLFALGSVGRAALWSAMLGTLDGIDLVHLQAVPALTVDGVDLFAELGDNVAADTLYRAQFSSWDEANTMQRSKSRRKHDRQQGERLEALGPVSFAEVRNGAAAGAILEVMFRQRAARFRVMGIADPFAPAAIRAFYDATVAQDSGVDVRLHVLRLNGEIVAVRYNVAHNDRLFCLVSSMSDDATIQTGSPGKQCLLRVMQMVFDAGCRVFDMGAGLTDEKRHWCNVQIPVRHHYLPLTPLGSIATEVHGGWQMLRAWIKANPRLLALARAIRGWKPLERPAPEPSAHE